MSETVEASTKAEKEEKREYKFDLSDGLGFEDIAAIFIWIFKAILFVLKVVLYPYYWISQEIGRTIHFLTNPHDEALTDDEKVYVQSVPFFFLMFGFFIGILIGALVIYVKIKDIRAFIQNFQVDVLIDLIVAVIRFIIDVLKLLIIGTWDVTTTILKIVFEAAASNVLLTFIILATIGLVAFIIFLIATETDYLHRIGSAINTGLHFVWSLPRKAYNWADNLYLKIITVLAGIVFGDPDLPYEMKFFRRVVGLSVGFSLYILITLLGILFIQQPTSTVEQALMYAIISVLGFGILCGLIAPYILTRALDKISKGKYRLSPE